MNSRIGFALLTSYFWMATLPASAQPSACDINGRLQQSTPNATYEKPYFADNGKNYPLEVLSLGEPARWGQNFICLRYEVENVGGHSIPIFFWELIDDYTAQDLPPASPRQRVRTRPSAFKDPIKSTTILKAFRTAKLETQVWRTVEDAQRKTASASGQELSLSFLRTSSVKGAVAAAVEAKLIPDVDIAVVRRASAGDTKLPFVSDEISNSFGAISTSSYGYVTEKEQFATGGITVSAAQDVKVQVYAPAIQALSESKTVEQFIKAIQSAREAREPLRFEVQFSRSYARYQSQTLPASRELYVVEHPITVVWQAPNLPPQSQCIRAASYSVFPVSVGREFCIDVRR